MKQRSFDWSDFVDVADQLLALVGGEGAERTATSRAYYGGYGMACAHAQSKILILARRGSDHTTIWTWFGNQPGTAHARISQAGRRLKRWQFRQTTTTSCAILGRRQCWPSRQRDNFFEIWKAFHEQHVYDASQVWQT